MSVRLTSRTTLVLLAALTWLCAAPHVDAGEDDAQKRARVFFQQGVDATAQAAYAAALTAFEQAHALRPHPATLYNIALSQWALGRPAAALRTLEHALAQSELNADKRKQAEVQRAEWLERVGRIRLSVEPQEALVRVDSQALDSSELLVLTPGWQQIEVQSAGYRSSTHRVYVRPGILIQLRVTLERPGPPSSDMAELEAVTFPYGKVWVNGAFAGESPLRLRLPAGSYRVAGGRENAEGETTLELRARESHQLVVHWDRARRGTLHPPGAPSTTRETSPGTRP
jgi:tetratricopeptide (TPR) repeat protein